jgi:phage host-nuclease inhibitor protein Gam
VAALEREIRENVALCEAAVGRLVARTETLNKRAAKGVDFFTGRIREYSEIHRAELLGGGKRKTRSLPHGSVAWKKRGGQPVVNDEKALLEWAIAQPPEQGLVRLSWTPAWSEIKEKVKATGEIPPGVDIEPESETFKIEAIGDSANEH